MSSHPNTHSLSFMVRIKANAKKTCIVGMHENIIKIHVAAPPVHGKANKTLIRFIASHFGIPKRDVSILSGLHDSNKRICICPNDIDHVRTQLDKILLSEPRKGAMENA